MAGVDAPLNERQDARELFERVAVRVRAGEMEAGGRIDVAHLAAELGWPLERAMVAMHVLERAGLMVKPPTGAES